MNRVGIVAAMPSELKPLVAGWKQRHAGVWTGRVGEIECTATAMGMGSAAATRACAAIFDGGAVDALISVGWAGSLSCGLKPPEPAEVSEVIDARTGERFSTGQTAGFRLVTLDHVAGVEEKRRLAATYQAVMVDMEAATVARLARARQIPFLCCKGISDGPNDVLPDFARFIDAQGQMRMVAFLAHVAVRPRYWKNLGRLGKNSRQAAERLSRLLSSVLARSGGFR